MPDTSLPVLLSLASHELRGPAGVARGYLRLIEQDPALPDRPRRAATEAAKALGRVVGLLDELTALSRAKEGQIKLALHLTSLRSVLTEAMQATTVPPGAEVDLDVVADRDVRLRVDAARLRDAFGTLILTLARAQAGASTIELRLVAPRAAGRGKPQVIVAPRSLGQATTEERPIDLSRGGVGLALALADALVQAHGGRLRERWVGGKWHGFVVKL
jgi:two-component system OmpR family sensor kinase